MTDISDMTPENGWIPAFLGDASEGMTIALEDAELDTSGMTPKAVYTLVTGTITNFYRISGTLHPIILFTVGSGEARKSRPDRKIWIKTDNEDEAGKTFIPDVYVVSGPYVWYWDAKDDIAFAPITYENGQTVIKWDEYNQVDSRADECSIRLESDMKDLLHKAHESYNRYMQALKDMPGNIVEGD